MAMGRVTKEESSFVVVEDGVYEAELATVDDIEGRYGPSMKFNFTITGPDSVAPEFIGMTVNMLCTAKLAPGNKLDEALVALGGAVEIGEDVDPADYIGTKCRVSVQAKEKDGKTYANVIRVLPFKRAAGGAPPAQRPAAAPAQRPAAAPAQRPAAAPAQRPAATATKKPADWD
jgi:hypothetical protein